MFGFCSDFSEGKDILSFTLSLAVYRHGYDGTGEGGIRTLVLPRALGRTNLPMKINMIKHR